MANVASRAKKRQSSIATDIPQLRPGTTKDILGLLTLAARASKRCHFVGFNSIMKNIENRSVAVVLLCHDAPLPLKEALYVAANTSNIPIRTLHNATSELTKIYSVNRISCIALPSAEDSEGAASSAVVDGVLDLINASST